MHYNRNVCDLILGVAFLTLRHFSQTLKYGEALYTKQNIRTQYKNNTDRLQDRVSVMSTHQQDSQLKVIMLILFTLQEYTTGFLPQSSSRLRHIRRNFNFPVP